MELLHRYYQEKREKDRGLLSSCELKVAEDLEYLVYASEYHCEYVRVGKTNAIKFVHHLTLNKLTGDFTVTYRIDNQYSNTSVLKRAGNWVKKNNFEYLTELTERGFYFGEKRINYWGVKYKKATSEILDVFLKSLKANMSSTYNQDKDYVVKPYVNPLYDLIVDFHLNKKGIKQHDDIYNDIIYDYPKPKWLKNNEFKFIPAVLDSYGIKCKYLVGELSYRESEHPIIIRSLNFLCKLFGENYLEYIKRLNWKKICSEKITSKKVYPCKNDAEKESLLNTLNNWDESEIMLDGRLKSINDLFTMRAFVEERGYVLKYKSKSSRDTSNLLEKWGLLKKHLKLGYKIRYNVPDDVIMDLEQPINYNGNVYKPMLILSEDQFKIEGMTMKNCMANQFNLGFHYLYIAMSCGGKRVNVQYRKGRLVQARGKTNIDLPAEFERPVEILSNRVVKYADLSWKREKYDIINDIKI